MPFIHVEMIEGRSREQKEALVKEVGLTPKSENLIKTP